MTGITYNNTGGAAQTTAVYADVQRSRYDTSYAYINSSGFTSYTMGLFRNSGAGLFGFWPLNQGYTCRITRNPGTPPAAKARHGGGLIGIMANGVGTYDLEDKFGFVQMASAPVAGSDSMGQTNATHPWGRDALAVEVDTFDPGFAHQPWLNCQYHYHAEPKALRYQLSDNMQATYSYNASTPQTTPGASTKSPAPL